jgi:hypothetical protein
VPHSEVRRGSNANLDGDRFLPLSSSRSSFTSPRQLSPFFRPMLIFLGFRSMIESVNRSSSDGSQEGVGKHDLWSAESEGFVSCSSGLIITNRAQVGRSVCSSSPTFRRKITGGNSLSLPVLQSCCCASYSSPCRCKTFVWLGN